MHTLSFSIPNAHVEHFTDGMESGATAVTARLDEHAAKQEIIAYFEIPPDRAEIAARLALLANLAGIPVPPTHYTDVPPTDWLEHVYRGLHPLRLGRFYVYGSHSHEQLPAASIPIQVDAATAFGSGHHATTAACLIALSDMAPAIAPHRMLDLGCGSGILAIGMAKLFRRKILALDIDAEAARVTALNARLNQCGSYIHAAAGGSDCPLLHRGAPYDLIMANILARPLTLMAHQLCHTLTPNGTIILSGLLTKQETFVANAYVQHGLRLVKSIRREEWSALVMKR